MSLIIDVGDKFCFK